MTFQEAHPELFNGSVDTTQDVKPFSNETGNSNVSPVANYQGTMTTTTPVASSTTTPVINNTNTNNYDSSNSNVGNNTSNNNVQQVSNYDPKPFENETINKNETFANKGLSEKQQGELQDLVKYKPVDTWTQTDWNNYNYAINLQDKSAQIETAINNDRINTPNDLSMIVSDLVSRELSQSGAKEVGDYAIESSKLPTNIAPTPEVDISGYKAYLTDTEYLALQQDQQRAKYWNEKQTAMENYINTTMNNMSSIADRIGSYANMIEAQQRELDTSSMIRLTNQANQEIEKATNNLTALLNSPSSSLSDITSKRIAKQEYNATIATYSAGVQKAQGNLNGALETINKYYSNIIDPLQRQFDDYDSLLYKSINLYGTYNQNYKEELKREQDKISSAIQYAKEQRDLYNTCLMDASYNNASKYYGLNASDSPYEMYSKIQQAKRDDAFKEAIRKQIPDLQVGMSDSIEDWVEALYSSPTYWASLSDDFNAGAFLKVLENGGNISDAFQSASSGFTIMNTTYGLNSELYNMNTLLKKNGNTQTERDEQRSVVNNMVNNGQINNAFNTMFAQNLSTEGANTKDDYEMWNEMLELLDSEAFVNFLNNYDGNFIKKLLDDTSGTLFGREIKNYKDAVVAQEIQQMFIKFRHIYTGVAFGKEENKQYLSMFPSLLGNKKFNKVRADALRNQASSRVNGILKTTGMTEAQINMMTASNKAQEDKNKSEDDFKKNNPNSSDLDMAIITGIVGASNKWNYDLTDRYKAGQCAKFTNDTIGAITGTRGGFGDYLDEKKNKIVEMGGTLFTGKTPTLEDFSNISEFGARQSEDGYVNVGAFDVILFDSPTTYNGKKTGHIGFVRGIKDGKLVIMESNYYGDETLTFNREVSLDDPSILGVVKYNQYNK